MLPSVVAALPERGETGNTPWSIPLSGQRVPSGEKDISVAQKQLKTILNHSSVPWKGIYLRRNEKASGMMAQ